jgi:hypothetical protein
VRKKKEVTYEHLRESFDYNSDTGSFVWKKAPKCVPGVLGKEAGRIKDNGNGKLYRSVELYNRPYLISRLIYFYMTGKWPAECIDHINGDSLDNRWCNLREATYAENNRNHKPWVRSNGLPVGVMKMKSGRYTSRVVCDRKAIHLGTFDTADEAYNAYVDARRKYFGDYSGF